MNHRTISATDRKLAKLCLACPVCRRARQRQSGLAFWLVTTVEANLCPACRAYERVYGRKSHEPLSAADPPPSAQHGG